MSQDTKGPFERVLEKRGLAKLVGGATAFVTETRKLPGLARNGYPVLIEGETGTGKELVARALHYMSPRASHPFVPVNCGCFTDSLLEDALFGHESGAFTDARGSRPGLVCQANRGTLFLDEVETLTTRAQAALLRVLQDGTFRALGSAHEQRADVRFIAATNTALRSLIDEGLFRRDLYYRLSVFSIRLPPLRERGGDILTLATHFLEKHCPPGATAPQLSPQACSSLLLFAWPGNVRELENAIIRGIEYCRGGVIEEKDLGLSTSPPGLIRTALGELPLNAKFNQLKKQVIEAFERLYLTELLCRHEGNVTRAARAAGKERRDLGRLLKKYQIDSKLFAKPCE